MERDELKKVIEANMHNYGFKIDDIRIQEDPYHGWRIAVISDDFGVVPMLFRKEKVLQGINLDLIQWVDLLTQEELLYAGDIQNDSELENLPLWSEAMARPLINGDIVFPSDLDEDLEVPIISTFYSLRGGVGRSTALTYTAKILAKRGHSVLCIDMDLEAPGLASLFDIDEEVNPNMGVLNVLSQIEMGENPDLLNHIIRVTDSAELYCLPAGIPNADYARRLRNIDPEMWYRQENNPLRKLMELVKELPLKIEFLLLDSRTGISPISAPLLFDLSDIALIAMYPHPQAKTGTGELVKALLKAESRRDNGQTRLTPEPRFIASPIPPREVEKYQHRTSEWTQEWFLNSAIPRLQTMSESEVSDIIHVVPYREIIAVSDRTLSDPDVLRNYEVVADWINRFLPSPEEKVASQTLPGVKQQVLNELTFSTGAAELQDEFLTTFVPTEIFQRARASERPLVIGRKGTGKTALFRWIVESKELPVAVVMCPAPFRASFPWVFSPDGYEAIDEFLKDSKVGWREFWMLSTAVSLYQILRQEGIVELPHESMAQSLKPIINNTVKSELEYVQIYKEALIVQSVGLYVWDWIQRLDNSIEKKYLLLFDGLDTGFGNSLTERRRRKVALEGLFTFVLDREKVLKSLRFKLLLREDIWNKLMFENKSHLNVRIVKLEWRSQVDYVRTAIKQAMQSKQFRNLAEEFVKSSVTRSNIEYWPEETVFEVWKLLVGERMKGGKTSYTLSWVWNRLADGNGDHSPRALFQLFNIATNWEEVEQRANPYDRSVIRPRALISALENVSAQALQSILEEFEELNVLTKRLQEIGRSPIEASLLNTAMGDEVGGDTLSLAKEVGLIAVYEETDEEIRRYRVPDLYRIALGMTRKGQA